jgi:hypothetical protein
LNAAVLIGAFDAPGAGGHDLFFTSAAEIRVVFPKPGGAEMMVALPFIPVCKRSSKREREINPSDRTGGYSFVVKIRSGMGAIIK